MLEAAVCVVVAEGCGETLVRTDCCAAIEEAPFIVHPEAVVADCNENKEDTTGGSSAMARTDSILLMGVDADVLRWHIAHCADAPDLAHVTFDRLQVSRFPPALWDRFS